VYHHSVKRIDKQRELNEALTPLSRFAETYNETLPLGFPHASNKALQKFQTSYPLLFKNDNSWSINKHRKRFMDWYMTHHMGAGEKRER